MAKSGFTIKLQLFLLRTNIDIVDVIVVMKMCGFQQLNQNLFIC